MWMTYLMWYVKKESFRTIWKINYFTNKYYFLFFWVVVKNIRWTYKKLFHFFSPFNIKHWSSSAFGIEPHFKFMYSLIVGLTNIWEGTWKMQSLFLFLFFLVWLHFYFCIIGPQCFHWNFCSIILALCPNQNSTHFKQLFMANFTIMTNILSSFFFF